MKRRRLSCSVSMMFREVPILERFALARAAGFEGVEIQFLAEGEPAAMAAAAQAAGVEIVLINVDLGDYLGGGPGLSGVPGREASFRDALDTAFRAAHVLKPAFVHIGPSRIPDGATEDACRATYLQNVRFAIQQRTERGIPARLVIEPMNRVEAPNALQRDVDEVARLIRSELRGDCGILFDVYHVAMNQQDPVAAYRAHAGLVAHVQFSDAPGRQEPGAGTLDLPAILGAIEAAGHSGWFGAEYMPRRPTPETLGWVSRMSNGA